MLSVFYFYSTIPTMRSSCLYSLAPVLLLIHLQVARPQPRLQMLIRRNRLPLRSILGTTLRKLPLGLVCAYPLARHGLQTRRAHGVAEEGDAVPRVVAALPNSVPRRPRRR